MTPIGPLLSEALLAFAALGLTVGCTATESCPNPVSCASLQPPTPTAGSSVKPHGIFGRATDDWDCNASPDVPAGIVNGDVTAITLCGHTTGPDWQNRMTVTDPEGLDMIARLLSRDDAEPSDLTDCPSTVPPVPPVLVRTTEGTWVVQTPKTACGATLPHVRKVLNSFGVRA